MLQGGGKSTTINHFHEKLLLLKVRCACVCVGGGVDASECTHLPVAAKQPTHRAPLEASSCLQDLMKTESGRRMAEARHAYMVDFLGQFQAEVQGLR